ncbi:MAG: DUF1579 family protein [Bacteroidetes bacterium]|nr:DUF1579 family protein [Bacteroidota bacterium]
MWTLRINQLPPLVLPFTLLLMFAGVPSAAQSLADWQGSGSNMEAYEFGGNPTVDRNSSDVGFIYSKSGEPSGFATWMCTISADGYRAHRLRLTAYVKTRDVVRAAVLWMRLDGADKKVLGFDNMQNRPIQGNTDWTTYEIVLDVPDAAEAIALGTILSGSGRVWTGDLKLEFVGDEVPVTDLGDPTESLRAPEEIAKNFDLFTGKWAGEVHQVMADGSKYDWPAVLNCENVLNGFAVQVKGSLKIQKDFVIDWLGVYSWDAARKRIVYFETSSAGEVFTLYGAWRGQQTPELELDGNEPAASETEGPASMHQVITFPEEDELTWEVVWKKNDMVIHQTFKARRQ